MRIPVDVYDAEQRAALAMVAAGKLRADQPMPLTDRLARKGLIQPIASRWQLTHYGHGVFDALQAVRSLSQPVSTPAPTRVCEAA